MADQDPFGGLRTGPWVGVNNDPLFQGLTDENTVTPGGVIEDQSITNAKIVNLNADKIDAGTLKVTGSMSIETSGLTPQLEIGPNGTIMRDNAGNVVLEINGSTTTFDADIISAGSITGSMIAADTITADNIVAGTITATEIADSTITGSKIVDGTITGAEIASATITSSNIVDGTITGTDIASATITGSNISSSTITSSNIVDGTITGTDISSATITGSNISNTTITASNIVDATITGAKIANATITDANVGSLNADKITSGTLTATAANGVAINAGSGKFTVDSSGNVVANSITLGSTATVSNTAGNEVTGSIYSRPGDNVTSAQFRLVADNSNNLTRSITGITSSGAAANANCTINATAHPFAAGQFVWFTGATGAGAAVLNTITESLPAQIVSTTTNAFVINYYLAIGAITGGTATAGKRLSVVAPSGLFVYQSDSKAGAIATGSIALGSSLTKLGKGSTATLADGEIGFLTSASPRYGSGANLYSKNGTTNLSTSGDFDVEGNIDIGVSDTSTAGAIIFKGGNGGSIRAFSATAGNDSIGIYNTSGSAFGFLVAENFYPGGQGSAFISHNGNFTMNDTLDITGSLTVSSNATVTGEIYAGGSIVDPSPLTTTATTNAAIWVIPAAGEPYGLRRNSSSARYKTNIVDADEAVLEAAKKVRPRHFESTIADEAGATRLGFIAEEILAAGLSHAVGYDEEGRVETLDSVALIAALFTRVNDLEKRLKVIEEA